MMSSLLKDLAEIGMAIGSNDIKVHRHSFTFFLSSSLLQAGGGENLKHETSSIETAAETGGLLCCSKPDHKGETNTTLGSFFF